MSSTDGLFETFAQIAQTDNARIIAQANERDLLNAAKKVLGTEMYFSDHPRRVEAFSELRAVVSRIERSRS